MYLLDTNVVSELRRPSRCDPGVWRWAQSVAADELYLSVMTVLETRIGMLRIEQRDPRQFAVLHAWLEGTILTGIQGRILEADVRVMLEAARLLAKASRPDRDAIIAATALVHNLTVVTRNVRDFRDTGVTVLNPWEFPAPTR